MRNKLGITIGIVGVFLIVTLVAGVQEAQPLLFWVIIGTLLFWIWTISDRGKGDGPL